MDEVGHALPALVVLIVAVASPAASGAAMPEGIQITDYDVALELDRAHSLVIGHERIRLRAATTAAQIAFPRNGITLRAAHTGTGEELKHLETADHIEIQLRMPLRPGKETSIQLDYEAVSPKGIVFQADAIYSIFHTCHWMICREQPAEKATLTLALTVPDELTVIASGLPVSQRHPRPAWTQHTWREEIPSSTYLFGFAVGRFAHATRTIAGSRFEYYGPELDTARLDEFAAEDARMLAFYVEKAGRPLPRPVYAQVVVDGDVAQEMSSFSLIGRDLVEGRRATATEDWAAAHELSHQFWGNLVTCADWPHFWLNEGITTFMVAAWKEHRWGRAAYERELALARKRHQTAIDAGLDVPLTYDGAYPSLRIKRAITYSKAMLFLDRLRTTVGEDAFWSALRAYTRRFSGHAVVSRDFEVAVKAATKIDVAPLFKEWVYGQPD
jgi:aminopeptidase N